LRDRPLTVTAEDIGDLFIVVPLVISLRVVGSEKAEARPLHNCIFVKGRLALHTNKKKRQFPANVARCQSAGASCMS
jgi:hypothetical protein